MPADRGICKENKIAPFILPPSTGFISKYKSMVNL